MFPGVHHHPPYQYDPDAPHPMRGMPLADPTYSVRYLRDFVHGIDDTGAGGWVQNGSGSSVLSSSELNGSIEVTTDATAADTYQIQQGVDSGSVQLAWELEVSKPFSFSTRFKMNNTDADGIVGLAVSETSIIADVSDGIFFRKNAGSTDIELVSIKDSDETVLTGITDLVTDTYIDVGFYWTGSGVQAFLKKTDGTWDEIAGVIAAADVATSTPFAVSIAATTAGGSRKLSVDYVYINKVR